MRPRAFSGLSKAALIIAVSSLSAACSSDVARFDQNPFQTNRQVASAPAREPAYSAPVSQVESAPLSAPGHGASGQVASAPLSAPPAGGSSSPFGRGADEGLTTGSATPRQHSTFGSANPATPAVRQMAMSQTVGGAAPGRGGWSATGGTNIRAQAGDTAESLSRRYGVPAQAIAQANGGSTAFSGGQNIVIPTYSMASAAAPQTPQAPQATRMAQAAPQPAVPQAAAPARGSDLVRQPAAPEVTRPVRQIPITAPQRPAPQAAAPQAGRMAWQAGAQPQSNQPAPAVAQHRPATGARPSSHTVASGETMGGVARRYGVTSAQLAQANGLQANQSLRIGQTLRLPGAAPTRTAEARPQSVEPRPAAAATPTPAQRREQAQRTVAQVQASPAGRGADQRATAAIPPSQTALAARQAERAAPAPAAAAEAPAPAPQPAAAAPAAPAAPAAAASAEPNFRWPVRGRVINGFRAGSSDGIRLAVPQGTPIKAAEDGVVAYAGSELRNYGNLVLVRHSNGYVTAYAHNSSIAVRRGEQVRRGQTIATAGQTGNVNSPQLHFEIRRGATPVDPMSMLGSN